jgi:hypothetical protein
MKLAAFAVWVSVACANCLLVSHISAAAPPLAPMHSMYYGGALRGMRSSQPPARSTHQIYRHREQTSNGWSVTFKQPMFGAAYWVLTDGNGNRLIMSGPGCGCQPDAGFTENIIDRIAHLLNEDDAKGGKP